MAGSNQPLSFSWPQYPLDKIFYASPQGASVAVPQNAFPGDPPMPRVSIPHTEGRTFFLDVQTSPDDSNWYDAGFEPFYLDVGTGQYYPRWECVWRVNSSAITLLLCANDQSRTIFYRMVGYYKE